MFTKPRIDEILFATDLSENAGHAFAYAAGMAEAFDARVTVLYVIEKLPPNAELLLVAMLGFRDGDELKQKSQAELAGRIKEHIGRICAAGADMTRGCHRLFGEVVVESGKAAERILHHVETGRYDTLVMGSRGHGLVKEVLMGGTSRRVIQDSPIPVFVIPMR